MGAFSLDDARIKLTERSRGRMKIQIKFSKEEAEGFKNFCQIKPKELADDEFYKQIFFAGCNAMTAQNQESQEQETQAETSEWPRKDEQEEE